ncbi:cytidylyltransferase domain-containing protein [Lentilitoribacter sp. EG35]|uniref:acylneuraminate cytidylyltransferase family protein n=1 Tax=Lentilitoribacter sp. EG35 TaxID=3234192 RepID=UPI0034613567
MNILALICARGGSKRLPGKNIKMLGGRPLIQWSIEAALSVPEITNILISTDDEDIANTARKCGISVPWLRPPELATDSASSVDVAIHALDYFEREHGELDGLILLQPTSPFRKPSSIKNAINIFCKQNKRPVVSVSKVKSHPMWCFEVNDNMMSPFIPGDGASTRYQDLPAAYSLNGLLYLISPARLRTEKSFIGDDCIPTICEDMIEAIDIDSEWDWQCAEKAVEFLSDRN